MACAKPDLFAPMAVRVHTGCSALHFNKTVNMITYKIKTRGPEGPEALT